MTRVSEETEVVAIISLFMVIVLSILVTRVATVALTHTGLAKEAARFQARSAFTGVGFTTSESEKVVNHPFRRRIFLLLMLLGNAGIVTAVTSLILTFIRIQSPERIGLRLGVLVLGLVVLWGIASSQWVERRLSNFISKMLKRHTQLDVQDYASLLHLAGEYRITELQVEEKDWLANKTLQDLELRQEGVVVLGITRQEGTFVGVPTGATKILPNDSILAYGRASSFEELDRRRKGRRGDRQHRKAVERQEQVIEQEAASDPAEEASDPPSHIKS